MAGSKHSGSIYPPERSCQVGKIESSGKSMTEKVESVYDGLLRNYSAA